MRMQLLLPGIAHVHDIPANGIYKPFGGE